MSTPTTKRRDEFEVYRLAGEFFGRLKHGLGFGELVMRCEDHSITFRWIFKARGKFYQSQWVYSLWDFAHADLLEIEAAHIVKLWRSQARREIEKDQPS